MQLVSSLVLFWSLAAVSNAIYMKSFEHSHGYHIHQFRMTGTSPPPAGLKNAMNETMELEFHAGEYVFQLDLTLKKNQWAQDSKIILEVDESGNPTKTLPLYHRAYTGVASITRGSKVETGRASVTFWECRKRASLAIVTEGDVYNVEMIEQKDAKLAMKGHNGGHGMYMTKRSDRRGNSASEGKLSRFRVGSRRLAQNDASRFFFASCFDAQMTSQRAVKIDLISDAAFESQVKGSAAAQQQMIADINKASDLIYSLQFRVWLLPGNVYVNGASGIAPTCAGFDTGSRLTKFLGYRKTGGKTNNRALSHLFTNCHPPPGTVGLAYVGVICSVDNGGGWSNFMPNGGTWEVVAHEIGHNFGAPHSFENGQGRTGGIMDYGDGKYPAPGQPDRVYAFNPLRKNDVCGAIAESLKGNWWNMAPKDCWTTYAGTTPPVVPTPQPTNAVPQPTQKPTTSRPTSAGPQPTPQPTMPTPPPTNRPTVTSPPSGTACTGLTFNVQWGWFTYSTATCQQYMTALRRFKPCIPQVVSCSATRIKDSWGARVDLTLKWVFSVAEYNAFDYTVYENGIVAELRKIPGIQFSRRRRLSGGSGAGANNTNSITNGVPVITYQWVMNGSYDACSPSCGKFRYQLETSLCQQTADNTRNGGGIDKVIVSDPQLCGLDLKPIVNTRRCSQTTCPGSCGDSQISGTEMCDTGLDPTCCAAGCQSYKTSPTACLTKNSKIDAAYMSCLNDAAHTGCHLYVFQGEYFMKYYAPNGHAALYDPVWHNGAIKHQGTFQPDWPTVTAVAGGRNGQVWAFNGLNFLQIDYSNENQGKVMARGTVDGTWQAPQAFKDCGTVTAADVVSERQIQLFCDYIYIFVYIPANKANQTVYPADGVFETTSGLGVNAFYFDNRDRTYRIFRRNIQQIYRQPGLASTSSATLSSIFGIGAQPKISTSQCAIADPECTACMGVNKCTACNPQYKVLVNRCIPEATLVDITFSSNQRQNDKFYSSDPTLQTANFVAGHGGQGGGAMEFTTTTSVMARSPTLNGRTVKDFRIEVFYKPSSVANRQTLITIDSRFQLDLKNVPNTQTMKLFVRFDNMAFECYVPNPLTLNKWNLVAVEFANRQIITSVNGFEHNRGFTQAGVSGPAALGLTFQNVTVGAKQGGLQGALDSLQIKEIPVQTSGINAANNADARPAWVVPIVIASVVLSLCLIAGIAYLAYQREMCGKKPSSNNDMQTAFLHASGQNSTGGNYVAMA